MAEVLPDHWPDGTWCNWNASVYVHPQSVLTQSPVPNQCESNGHLSVQSVYKLVWQKWL